MRMLLVANRCSGSASSRSGLTLLSLPLLACSPPAAATYNQSEHAAARPRPDVAPAVAQLFGATAFIDVAGEVGGQAIDCATAELRIDGFTLEAATRVEAPPAGGAAQAPAVEQAVSAGWPFCSVVLVQFQPVRGLEPGALVSDNCRVCEKPIGKSLKSHMFGCEWCGRWVHYACAEGGLISRPACADVHVVVGGEEDAGDAVQVDELQHQQSGCVVANVPRPTHKTNRPAHHPAPGFLGLCCQRACSLSAATIVRITFSSPPQCAIWKRPPGAAFRRDAVAGPGAEVAAGADGAGVAAAAELEKLRLARFMEFRVSPRDAEALLASIRVACGAERVVEYAHDADMIWPDIPAVPAAPVAALAPRLPALPNLITAGKNTQLLQQLLTFAQSMEGRLARFRSSVEREIARRAAGDDADEEVLDDVTYWSGNDALSLVSRCPCCDHFLVLVPGYDLPFDLSAKPYRVHGLDDTGVCGSFAGATPLQAIGPSPAVLAMLAGRRRAAQAPAALDGNLHLNDEASSDSGSEAGSNAGDAGRHDQREHAAANLLEAEEEAYGQDIFGEEGGDAEGGAEEAAGV